MKTTDIQIQIKYYRVISELAQSISYKDSIVVNQPCEIKDRMYDKMLDESLAAITKYRTNHAEIIEAKLLRYLGTWFRNVRKQIVSNNNRRKQQRDRGTIVISLDDRDREIHREVNSSQMKHLVAAENAEASHAAIIISCSGLSRQERALLDMLSKKVPYIEIADKLGVAERTVSRRVKELREYIIRQCRKMQ